mgnify:CR=1 FL=1
MGSLRIDPFLLFLTLLACVMILSEWIKGRREQKRRRVSHYLGDMARTRAIFHAKKWQATQNPIYLELMKREMEVYRRNR